MFYLENSLQRLLRDLKKLFDDGKASPLDTDREGRTLLYVRELHVSVI
jgi:hypothetical protein